MERRKKVNEKKDEWRYPDCTREIPNLSRYTREINYRWAFFFSFFLLLLLSFIPFQRHLIMSTLTIRPVRTPALSTHIHFSFSIRLSPCRLPKYLSIYLYRSVSISLPLHTDACSRETNTCYIERQKAISHYWKRETKPCERSRAHRREGERNEEREEVEGEIEEQEKRKSFFLHRLRRFFSLPRWDFWQWREQQMCFEALEEFEQG